MYFTLFNHFKYCFIFLISFLLLSCSSIVQSTIKDDGVQIPPDFGKDDITILAVKTGGKKYNRTLEKVLPKSYNGKYVIIEPDQIDDTTYSDKSKYRYVFDNSVYTGVYRYNIETHSEVGMGVMKFQLYDRITGKSYQTKTGMSGYGKLMHLYLRKLDRKRMSYQQIHDSIK